MTYRNFILIFLLLIFAAFSTDVRFAYTLQIDPDARPSFQLFEFVTAMLVLLRVYGHIHGRLYFLKGDIYLLFFVLWAVGIAAIDGDFNHNISRAKDFFVAWVIFATIRDSKLNLAQRQILLNVIILLSSLCATLGLIQMANLEFWNQSALGEFFRSIVNWKVIYAPLSGEVLDQGFAQCLYWYPQAFTYYLIVPFFTASAFARNSPLARILAFLFFVVILGTGSKTFVVLILFLVLIKLIDKMSKNTVDVKIVYFLVCLFIGYGLLILSFGEYRTVGMLGTFIWRLDQWTDTFAMMIDHPFVLLTGHGTYLLETVYSRFNYPNPHNVFLYLLTEFGIVGVTLFLLFLVENLKSYDLPKKSHLTIFEVTALGGIRSGLLMTMVMMIVDDFFVQTQLTAIFFFYLGLVRNYQIHSAVPRKLISGITNSSLKNKWRTYVRN